MVVGYGTGVAYALPYRYTQHLTTFVNQSPESIRNYSALPDA